MDDLDWDIPPGSGDPEDSPVRPYAVTGGRTTPCMRLAVEALVSSATAPPHDFALINPEYADIDQLCRQARSVAEVSALLRLPLGVVRVLIADMAAQGLLQVDQPRLRDGRPDPALLERVLTGLRRL
ncbi:DUF742 domain-containing protein [Nonomuraea sp. SYSU D8015]|uniref:DUF742 domain-containing protein n=1 Tax=Nonomuraea sp. SYSU D8015 TaxID=2593644 RepID=UPI00166175D1|nr:DUF742 domain-containing protein [Nonomuraea sp. SYSU D8015]